MSDKGLEGHASQRDLAATSEPSHAVHAGVLLAGRYKLLEAIGEGGMGTVWVAEQTEPVRRKVAVKLIKAGMDSRSVMARFEAERQALAVMDHPNIAKVLDGGTTETGRPYFVMEYVKGVPITEFCDATRLSVRERLQLFIQVCEAVQHAHQKGIIHRDLKPSNILIAPYDGHPVPKVIDFGLAKAMHQPLTERTLHTAHDMVLGTPLYMSPEQAQLNNLDVDTRSDVYSLGVLLYELLTGTTPLEKQRLKEAAWDEIKRIIREEEPPRPSTRLSSTALLPSLAAGRQIEPAQLTRLVRGELDWIAMRALEKDRSRRYETATALARDVQRFLADEVVEARPPSVSYRLHKFIRRHKGQAVAAALIFLAILGGISGAMYGVIEASKQRETHLLRNQAEQERDAARLARSAAEEAREAERKAKITAEQARDELAQEREKIARIEYGRTIQVAYEQWRDNKIAAARALLESTRKDLRGWEWHYVHRLCHADLITLSGHTAAVTSAAWSRDGSQITTASKDGSVRTWDAKTGEPLATRLPKENPVHRVTLNTDGSQALFCNDHVGSFAGFLSKLTGEGKQALKGHTQRAFAVTFSQDGARLLTGSEDKTARAWDTKTGALLFTFKEHKRRILQVSLSADGFRAATAGEGEVAKVWDTQTGDELLTIPGRGVTDIVQLRADGKQVLCGSGYTGAKVIDVATGDEVLALNGHTNAVAAAAWSPDGSRIATAGHDNLVKVWDAINGAHLFTLKGHTATVWKAVWSPDGSQIVTASEDHTARVWDAVTGDKMLVLKEVTTPFTSAAFSRDQVRLVTGSFDNTTKIWDGKTGDELRVLQAPIDPGVRIGGENIYIRSASFSPNGSRVVTGSWDKTARVWDVATGHELIKFNKHKGVVNSAAFSPDGRHVVSGSVDHSAKVWDTETGDQLLNLQHAGAVTCAAWSTDGARIVTGSFDNTAKVWNAKTGEEIHTLPGHKFGVDAAAFDRDDLRIVTASTDATARIWDARTGAELRVLQGHTGGLYAASWSADGKRIITGSSDGTAKVWDAESGADLLTLKEDIGWVETAAFQSDDRVLLGSHSRVKILDARPLNRQFLSSTK